jgi:hypothetical protein
MQRLVLSLIVLLVLTRSAFSQDGPTRSLFRI